ncbi:hypothetical protein Syun_000676 [Stephania yunnanensis]|uniref:Uncharacterized protein n=1 Tax=Stephania yunnanensis TaxID=152371 RepID=A0AAP0QA51_9MAGN
MLLCDIKFLHVISRGPHLSKLKASQLSLTDIKFLHDICSHSLPRDRLPPHDRPLPQGGGREAAVEQQRTQNIK